MAQLLDLAVQSAGGTISDTGKAPLGASDFAPAVEAASADTGCVAVLVAQAGAQVIAAQAASGKVMLSGSADSMVPQQVIAQQGEAADGFVSPNEYLPLNDTTETAGMKEFLKRGRAISKDFDPEGGAASAYLGPQVIKAAIEATGTDEPVTRESILSALPELKGFDTGLGPVVDFTQRNPSKGFSRLPSANQMYIWVADGGQFVLGDADPITITSVFEAAAAAGQ